MPVFDWWIIMPMPLESSISLARPKSMTLIFSYGVSGSTTIRLAGDMLVHDLDDDWPAQIGLLGEIDSAHAAFAEESDGLVASEENTAGHGWIHLMGRGWASMQL